MILYQNFDVAFAKATAHSIKDTKGVFSAVLTDLSKAF